MIGLVSMILMRTLRNDHAKYAREDDDPESLVMCNNEFGKYSFSGQTNKRECWKGQMAQCLVGEDLHRALVLVTRCKMASFTGVSAIMIRETAETFGIITKDNKYKEKVVRN
ncbi:unnamed protein product [Lactuca saligna]|uniref:Uncharacterized protein n=1 Tax=Lactuca saligna TaxID=75948 RepID=A0AA36A398_LACSI|nr:unnamed protein product [Lactuca saligna]